MFTPILPRTCRAILAEQRILTPLTAGVDIVEEADLGIARCEQTAPIQFVQDVWHCNETD
jgi:hypothetical protein